MTPNNSNSASETNFKCFFKKLNDMILQFKNVWYYNNYRLFDIILRKTSSWFKKCGAIKIVDCCVY